MRHHATLSPYRHSSRALGILCMGMALAGAAAETQAQINYPDFSSAAGLQLLGDTAVTNGVLRVAPAVGGTNFAGAAWNKTLVNVGGGFQTTFQFQITNPGGPAGSGDGFAFVIQNSSTGLSSIGGGGGGIGYDGIDRSVAVEFDTFDNWNLSDPNDNHISVHTAGALPNSADELYSLGSTTAIPNLKDGAVHTVKVRYAPGTSPSFSMLYVYIDDLNNPVLGVACDLPSHGMTNGQAYLGFTAGWYGGSQNDDILSWTMSPPSVPPVISNVSASPTNIWPPNHKLAPVTVAYTVTDDTDPSPSSSLSVACSDSSAVAGTDWQVIDAHHVTVKAEKNRVYTITITATNNAGQSVQKTVTVSVTNPH